MTPQPEPTPARPPDVDTGFWLWVAAVPLMTVGFVVDLVARPAPDSPMITYALTGVFLVVLVAIVVTFLLLLRQGYRWARTLLTSGGLAAVVYSAISLFADERPVAAAALAYAATTIIGSVLIAGGAYLLHRDEAHAYFVR